MDNDVEEFLTTGKFSKKESVKARNELLDCIRSCLDVMQDSLDWNYLKTYYNNDRLDSKDEYDETVDVDTGSSLGDPIDWEFESIDPKGICNFIICSITYALVGEIEMPDDLTKIVFGQVDILTLKVVCC